MRSYWALLFLLASIWGASYLFIKEAVEDLEPATMMDMRTLGAALLLFAYLTYSLGAREAAAEVRRSWRPALVLGTFNAALPFWLVAWGEKHIDSSIAGIAQSTVPIFVFLLGLRFLPHEHVGLARIAGVAVGFAGVAALVGFDPSRDWWAIAGTLAVVVSSLSYAWGAVYGQLRVGTVSGPVLATGSMAVATLVLLPLAVFQLPSHAPDVEAVASLAALTLLGTALGQLILFRILRLYGSRKSSLVTYLMPGFALAYGALLLDEPVTGASVAGLALILAGVTLASGQRFLGGRSAAIQETT